MAEVDALYTNWRTLLAGDTANNDEFTWTAGEINEKLKAVQPDIQDLEDTVAIVEQHPTKFSLAANELTERKRFISSVKQRIQVRLDEHKRLDEHRHRDLNQTHHIRDAACPRRARAHRTLCRTCRAPQRAARSTRTSARCVPFRAQSRARGAGRAEPGHRARGAGSSGGLA